MSRSLQIRAALCAGVILLSIFLLVPTFQAMSITAADRADPAQAERIARIEQKAIRRGLDLQGGMHLVLEIDEEGLTHDQARDALARVVEIISNRVNQFGVSEPIIQTQGTSRIIVQLPGLQDPERAKNLIGQTARLEFRLVRPEDEVAGLLARLDEAFKTTRQRDAGQAEPEVEPGAAATDTALTGPLGELPAPVAAGERLEDDPWVLDHPFSAYVTNDPNVSRMHGTPLFVAAEDLPRVQRMLAAPEARVIPKNVVLMFDRELVNVGSGLRGRPLYVLNAEAHVEGGELTSARTAPDPERPGGWQVEMSLDRKGARKFSKVTGENIGRHLAITLDGSVASAPVIRGKIPSGRASISGSFTSEEASDLALLLRAGALPTNVRIEEERTVGPGLGRDSIRQGLNAGLIGAVLVVIFILIYYQATGLIAIAALVVNMLVMMAVLAQFGLVLTLPGIAGIVLTVGMAVDANVLINERIREELRKNKTVRAAVDSGYANATRTILDANITTLITSVILLWFGTGPIKGFAVTLSIGVVTSVFTALVMTRVIMEALTRDPRRTKLSI